MHGGKEEKLITKKIDFAKKSIDYLLHSNSSKTNDLNKSKIKYIKIDNIEKINF